MRDRPRTAADRQFCRLADASRDFVAVVDVTGRVMFMNPAARRMLGLAPSATLPATLAEWVMSEDADAAARVIETAAGGSAAREGHTRFRHAQTGTAVSVTWQVFGLDATDAPAIAIVAHAAEMPACAPTAQTRTEASDANAELAREVAVLETFSLPPADTSVTARLLGVVALRARAPSQYWQIFEQYSKVLDASLDRHTYRQPPPATSHGLRAIADALGELGAGPREVAELHARALRQKARESTVAKAQLYASEGRLVAFELMGYLLSFYRRRAMSAVEGNRG